MDCFIRLSCKSKEEIFTVLLKVFSLKIHSRHREGQNKMNTGGCNNDNPKVGMRKANMKTKEQESSGKKNETFYVVNRGKGSRE